MSFDSLAPVYRLMEGIAAGKKLQRCRTAFLEEIEIPRNILTLGEGHGRFLCACRRRFPEAAITCVDTSKGMIRQARQALVKEGLSDQGVTFVEADALAWLPPVAEFDLIVTHFFLDCFRADQLDVIVPRMARAGTSHATWLVADFQTAPHGWRRLRSQAILAIMYRFFRVFALLPAKELVPPDEFLLRSGFSLNRRVEMEWGLLKSEWWTRSPE